MMFVAVEEDEEEEEVVVVVVVTMVVAVVTAVEGGSGFGNGIGDEERGRIPATPPLQSMQQVTVPNTHPV